MKLLVDMNLSPRWVDFLREAGWNSTHWSQVGESGAHDSEIMAYAAVNNFVVLTHDLDFGAILAVTRGKKPAWRRSEAVTPALKPSGSKL